jgi:hypothetical protein
MAIPLTEEEEKYLLAETAATGPAPLTPEEQAFADGEEYVAPVASTVENIRHAAGGPIQGMFDAADLPSAIGQGIDAVEGYMPEGLQEWGRKISPVTAGAIDMFQEAAKREGPISEKPGLKQAKAFLAPEYEGAAPWAEATRTFGEWAGPGLGANLVKQGTKAIPKALQNARADIFAGTGAAGGQYVGEEYAESGTAGELIGGVTALIAAVATGKRGGLSKVQAQALADIEDQFDNPAEVIAEVRRRYGAGEKGTVADLAQDQQGVFELEELVGQTPGVRRQQNAVAGDRIQQIYDETLAPLGNADRELAPMAAEQAIETQVRQSATQTGAREAQITAEEAAQQQGLAQARKAAEGQVTAARAAQKLADEEAQAAATAVNPNRTTVEASESFSANRKKARDAFVEEVRAPAWKAVDEGPPLSTRAVRKSGKKFLDAMDPDDAADLLDHPVYGKLIKRISKWGDTVAPGVVTRLISRMKSEMNAADKFGWPERQLDDFVGVLEDELATPGSLYEKARAASAEEFKRFEPGRTKGVARADEAETEIARLGTRGDQGAATARLSQEAGVPAADRDLYDYVLKQATDQGGNITQDFLDSYRGIIDKMPAEDQAKLQRLVNTRGTQGTALTQTKAAQAEADDVARTTAREGKGLEQAANADRKSAGRVGDQREKVIKAQPLNRLAEKARGTVKDLVNKPDNLPDLKTLVAEIDELGQLDSFKALIRDNLEEQLFVKTAKTKAARKKAYESFEKVKDNLVKSGVLSSDQADEMSELLARADTAGLRQAARASSLTKEASEAVDVASSGTGAAILATLPNSVNTLMIGSTVRRSLRRLLHGKVTKRRLAAISDYTTNPGKYLEGLDQATTPEEVQRLFLTQLVGAGQAAELMTGE